LRNGSEKSNRCFYRFIQAVEIGIQGLTATWQTKTDSKGKYLKEIQRLVNEGVVEQEASRWAVSPFPQVYRALRDGEMTIGGQKFSFNEGDQLVFQCRMSQEKKGLPGPVLISKFSPAERDRYCGDMSGMGKMDESK